MAGRHWTGVSPQTTTSTCQDKCDHVRVSLADLSALDLAVVAVAAALIGFAKTAVSGAGAVAAALFATVLPARESTGALLPLLIFGDVFAVASYWRSAHWPTIARLAGPVMVGILAGAAFVAVSGDVLMKRTIGAVLLALVLLRIVTTRWAPERLEREQGQVAHWGYGWLGGFTTMVANAAGPVMSLYLLGARFDKVAFLGTMAWFFAMVNLAKLPFSIGLGLVSAPSLLLNLVLLPAVVVGAVVGRAVVRRIDQQTFEKAVLLLSAVAAANLLV